MKWRTTWVIALVCLSWPLAASHAHLSAKGQDGQKRLDRVLKRFVRDGLVDYQAIAKDEDFQQFLAWLETARPESLQTKEERLAFWINAYNASAIAGVIRHFPLKKVLEVDGFFSKEQHAVAGSTYTLDQIEKEILFKKFGDPRLHFVLVCAAKSCSGLPSEAYSGPTVLRKMDEVARAFLNNPRKNRLDRSNKIFYLSQIFNWYASDFTGNGTTVLSFIEPFLSADKRAFISRNKVEIKYLEYDWSLNLRD
ncbi:MAG: DUF547 domain-containing protein [bacterium]